MAYTIFHSARKFALVVLLFVFSSQLHAQYENGSLLGTVRDSSGAPIVNAALAITNTATAITTQAKTNDVGDYDVPSLRVGIYTITASSPGFSDAVAQNITVSVGNRQHIDLTLKVGAAQSTVEVTDVALQMETESSERGQTITNYQSESLPLVSRNYSDFLALVPGSRQAPTAALTSSVNSLLRAGAYNVNGQRSMFNNFLLDGLDNNAWGESNQGFDNQIIAVPPDSVAQFQFVTNNESAEYGRSSGATINVATQSGSNRVHATLYEFIRNTDLNAAGFFKPLVVGGSGITTPFKKPTFNRNQYGFNVGGPIIKDKLFYFLDYEGFRQVLKPLSVLTLPTQNELYGGPSGSIASPTPTLVVAVKNATTGTVYTANTPIPTSAINPLSLQIIKDFASISSALPAAGLATTGLASNDYAVQVPFTDHSDKGDLRLDWQIDANSSSFLRISDRKEDGVNYPSIPDTAGWPDQRQDQDSRPADCARLYPFLRCKQDSGRTAGPGSHQGRQVQPLHREHCVQLYSRAADDQRGGGRRPAIAGHLGLHGIWPAEHQPAVAEPGADQSQGELHLGEGTTLAEVRLGVRAPVDGRERQQPAVRLVDLRGRLLERRRIDRLRHLLG
jgi:hypothetical protein